MPDITPTHTYMGYVESCISLYPSHINTPPIHMIMPTYAYIYRCDTHTDTHSYIFIYAPFVPITFPTSPCIIPMWET